MNEKLSKIKANAKQKIKDHAPTLITFGVSTVAIVAYAAYAVRDLKDPANGTPVVLAPDDIEILESNGDAYMVMTPEELQRTLMGMSSTCFKLDDDHHYSLTQNDCTDEH